MRRVHLLAFLAVVLTVTSCGGEATSEPIVGSGAAGTEVAGCPPPDEGVIASAELASTLLAQKDSWHLVTAEQVQAMLDSAEIVPGNPRSSHITGPSALSTVGGQTIRVGTEAIEDWKGVELVGDLAIGGTFDEGFPDTWLWKILATSEKPGLDRVGFLGCRNSGLDLAIAASSRVGSLGDLIALATDETLLAEWEGELLGDRTPLSWGERSPHLRNLDPEETPQEVLSQLEEIFFNVVIPQDWIQFEEIAICTFVKDFGRNECLSFASSGQVELELSGYLSSSALLEFSLIDATTGEILTDLGVRNMASGGNDRLVLSATREMLTEEAFRSGDIQLSD